MTETWKGHGDMQVVTVGQCQQVLASRPAGSSFVLVIIKFANDLHEIIFSHFKDYKYELAL